MPDLIWVYAEVVDGRISRATLEMLSKAAELGRAEAVLLGPAPDDGVAILSAHGASTIYRSDDPVYRDCLTLPAVETMATLIARMDLTSCSSRRATAARRRRGALCEARLRSDHRRGDLALRDGAIEATIPALGAAIRTPAR